MSVDSLLISVITPCMNEEEGIADCYQAVRLIFERDLPDYDYEHIFCDNASTDSTVADVLKRIAEPRPEGQVDASSHGTSRRTSSSIHNGLLSARGDAILVALAADLQDPPELIPEFVAKWRDGHEIVYGIRRQRARKGGRCGPRGGSTTGSSEAPPSFRCQSTSASSS